MASPSSSNSQDSPAVQGSSSESAPGPTFPKLETSPRLRAKDSSSESALVPTSPKKETSQPADEVLKPFGNQHPAIQMLAKDCLHCSTILYQNLDYFTNCRNQLEPEVSALSSTEASNGTQLPGAVVFAKPLHTPSEDHLKVLKKFSKVSIFAPTTSSTAMLAGIYKYKDELTAERNKNLTLTDPQKEKLADLVSDLEKIGVNHVAVIAFRGTNTFDDVRKDLMFHQVEFCQVNNKKVMVHKGFYNFFSALENKLDTLLGDGGDLAGLPVLFTGHSLGGALSLLATLRFKLGLDLLDPAQRGDRESREMGFITFGCPRVGNIPFCKALDTKCTLGLRLKAGCDPVVKVPFRAPNHLLHMAIVSITGEVPGDPLEPISYFETEVKFHLHLGRRDNHINYPINIYDLFDHHPDFYSRLMEKDDTNAEPPVGTIIGDLPWFPWLKAGCDTVCHFIFGHLRQRA